jgi:multicomponent Na+:H+ antiporter subunit E
VNPLRAAVLFTALLAFWLGLSGRLDPVFVTLGVVSAALLTPPSEHLISTVLGRREQRARIHLGALVVYLLWLLTRIPPAGFSVAATVLHPRRSARPGVVRFRTGLPSPAARTLLANSITLVPGTMTVNVEDDRFTVHAFDPQSAEDLATAAVQRRIARIFRVEPDEPPRMEWEPVHDKLPEDPA